MKIKKIAQFSLMTTALTTTIVMAANAQEATTENTPPTAAAAERDLTVMERVMVIGHKEKVQDMTGSAHFVGEDIIDTYAYSDINRVLRNVPGVNLQEEEGYGNRPNIGLRGGRSERSADITLMEDGILIAPAPYAASSAYYFPRVARMSGVEVRKGSSTVKFGPRTTSGVVNLISSQIPAERSGEAVIAYGEDNTKRLQLNAGDTIDNWGYVVDFGHEATDGFKKLDNGGDTGYELSDAMAKFRVNTNPSSDIYQSLEVKLGRTHENSDETYLGLTEEDFNATPFRRYAASQRDNMDADHKQFHIRHYADFDNGLDLTTTAYSNSFARNWYKLQSVNDGATKLGISSALGSATHLAALKGEGDADDTFIIRANNREYQSYGIQSQLGLEADIYNTQNQIEIGVRYHSDEEDRFQHEDTYSMVNGSLVLSSAGDPGSNANRVGSADAYAFYVQDEIKTGNWTIVPGVRYEHIKLKREDYGKSDPTRSGASLSTNENSIDAIVPGVGVNYKLNNNINLIGGVHKGFAPPAPPSSSTVQADEEESVNYEAGIRYNRGALQTEAIGFFNDYENLLGEETLSSGSGTGTGEQFNGGEVDVWGIELTASYDLNEYFNSTQYQFPVTLSYTYTKAEFQNSFESDFDEWGSVTSGDELPYIPEHQFAITAGIAADKWQANITGKYMDEMRTTAGSGNIPAGEGTDSHFIVDLAAEHEVYNNTRAFVTVDNIFDETYVAARRPAGARPGKPRTFLAGLKVKF